MPRTQTNPAWGALLDLSAARPGPLHAKLTGALRAAVRDGRLPRGAALPPSRMLAEELKVSRSTVTRAYGQLITEGYLSAHQGEATRVAWSADPDETDSIRFRRTAFAVGVLAEAIRHVQRAAVLGTGD